MKSRKRRSDRNHVIYLIKDHFSLETYIGLTVLRYSGNIKKTLALRFRQHLQRANNEQKVWNLSRALRERDVNNFTIEAIEIVRGKKNGHARETELINRFNPVLNTFGVKQ